MADLTDRGTTPLNYGVYYKNTLVALCHALEDCILTSDSAPLVVTAFQRGKWYLEEADRYGAIADQAQQIVIMASPDGGFHDHPTSQRANIALVDLAEADPVAQEWHLMILSSNYTAMVLCQELSPADYGKGGRPDHDLERKFYGFWTFEPTLVREAVELAIAHLGRYDADLQAQLADHIAALRQQNPALDSGESTTVSQAVTQVVHYLQTRRHDIRGDLSFRLGDDLVQNLASNELQAFLRMAQLVDLSDPVNPFAATEVVSLLEMMGQLLDLPAWRLQRLRLTGMLYRIAPAAPDSAALTTEAPSCPLVAEVQALRLMPRLRAVAAIIAHQGERWDGNGHPAGLAGDAVPLEARMLGLVAEFQQRFTHLRHQADEATPADELLAEALSTCQSEAGERWDPKLVDILALVVMGLQQGLSLPTIPAQVTIASGLLNPDLDDQDFAFQPPSELLSQ
ncbi:MAG: DICT sensory domain-containing protein [Nodosilinea sp.]